MIFRRRSAGRSGEPNEVDRDSDQGHADLDERSRGPWDRDETTVDEGDDSYIDLGGLKVKGAEGVELRLQVENQQGSVAGVMLAGPDSGLELRAFAAPRSGGIWDEVRADLAAEAARVGGSVTESDGEYGTELTVKVPLQTSDGKQASQVSRIVGVEGPRWLLRGTFLGSSALKPDPDGILEQAFRSVIVVRGNDPMAPRDMIAMQVPAAAQAQLMGEAPDEPGEDGPA